MKIICSIEHNSVKHKYTVQLSKTFIFQTIQVVICNNSVKCKYSFNVENSSISNISVKHKHAV